MDNVPNCDSFIKHMDLFFRYEKFITLPLERGLGYTHWNDSSFVGTIRTARMPSVTKC
jgi:hypothetical protein